eukprot:6464824-Amphidinium_carterae.1
MLGHIVGFQIPRKVAFGLASRRLQRSQVVDGSAGFQCSLDTSDEYTNTSAKLSTAALHVGKHLRKILELYKWSFEFASLWSFNVLLPQPSGSLKLKCLYHHRNAPLHPIGWSTCAGHLLLLHNRIRAAWFLCSCMEPTRNFLRGAQST